VHRKRHEFLLKSRGKNTRKSVLSLVFPVPFCAKRMFVSANNSRINYHPFHIGIFDQCIENTSAKSHFLKSLVRSALEMFVDAAPLFAIFFRQTAPSSAVFACPNNLFYEFLLSGTGRPTQPSSPRKTLEIRYLVFS
jgi:hypothetical protein